MTNPRDTGRYDAFTDSYVDQQVRVDFAWGNIPMQPNDDRGMAQLNPALDSHVIATSQYEGFPAFTPGAPFDDTIPNVEVPDLIGMLTGLAYGAVDALGLQYSVTDTRTDGATEGNDSHVYSQTPAPGTLVNVGDTVYTVIYEYVPTTTTVPNLAGQDQTAVNLLLSTAQLISGTVTTSETGANSGNNGKVKSQTPAAGSIVNIGSSVDYVKYNYVNHTVAGIRTAPDGDIYRYLYLQGRNSGLTAGSGITLSGTGVANYDRPFDVISVVNDDAFNTGGQKLLIRNGLMDATGGDVTNTGTWALT